MNSLKYFNGGKIDHVFKYEKINTKKTLEAI